MSHQQVAEQNWHCDQKCDKQDIGSWGVKENSLVEGGFEIKLSNQLE